MAEPIFDDIEKAPTEPNLSITSNDIEIELNEKFTVFPLSLADDAKNGGLVREMEKSPLGRSLLRNYSVDSISNHTIERMKCWTNEKTGELIHSNTYQTQNQSNTAIDSFFKAYDVRNIGKESEQGQIKRKDNNNDDKQPNKRSCKAEKFEAIQYSIGPNKEYIAIRSYEYDIWERNEDNLSIIYQDIFQKKDEGWKVTRTKK
ncbi:hypothetical protein Tco_1139715 [Tanacetum coccineum]